MSKLLAVCAALAAACVPAAAGWQATQAPRANATIARQNQR